MENYKNMPIEDVKKTVRDLLTILFEKDKDAAEEIIKTVKAAKKTRKPRKQGNLYKCFILEDSTITDTAYINGYDLGDRILEDVWLKCQIVNFKLLVSFVDPDNSYVKSLSGAKWFKAAREFADVNSEIFYESASLNGQFATIVPKEKHEQQTQTQT